MDLNSPEVWRWIWFVAAACFASGEIVTPTTFFFMPFALGAVVAGVLAFLGVPVAIEAVIFLLVSAAAFAALWPLGRRMEHLDGEQEGVGATRWIGQEARVVEEIPEAGFGVVRLEREEWRAESLTGASIRKNSTVMITRLAGTRLVVVPVDEPADDLPLPRNQLDSGGSGSGPTEGVL